MEEYKKEFDFLFENTGTAHAVLNTDSTIHSINKNFEELCGYSQKEIVEKNFLINFISGKCHSNIKKYLEAFSINSSANLGTETFECKFFNRQGYQKIIVLTLNWIPEYQKFFATLTDVSKIRRTQLGSINSEQRDTIAKFGSGVAHEVKNPLQSINTSVDVLRDGLELNNQDQELMDIICEEVMNLNGIIGKFWEFTRNEDPKFEFSQINSLIYETLQRFEKYFVIGIEKKIKLEKNLPEAFIDRKQMSDVLKHIITNAVEAMPQGGNISVYSSIITNEFHEKQIQIKIKDNGTGMYEADFERMFIPFFSTKINHIGLGLAYCERIIYYHNGEIKVETELDQGTAVFINLPLTYPL
ncbi:PAS domain S-box protein [candidate division KSB1 bacterium]|nr:PAS domain S-box protein [candidate division KSB1 bacterium]